MATVTNTTTDANGNIIVNVSSSADDSITLATAGTYSDKNIIFNITASTDVAELPSAKWSDVTFIDYDGMVLYSYSLAEAQVLTELPALPTHEGLICQGWNWTLDAIKALSRPVTVGAMYITDDGATRLHIRIATVGRMTVPLYIGQTVANGVSIDWGDGSAAKTLEGTGGKITAHAYAKPGDYVISLMPKDDCTLSFGLNSSMYCIMGSTTEDANKVYCNMLQNVFIGKNVTSIGNSAFYGCHSLASITIPNSITSISNNVFYKCYSLVSITIPNSVTSIGSGAFNSCYSLASITIPDSVTSIAGSAFYYCYSLVRITIPNNVTFISMNAFLNCYSFASIIIPDGVTKINDSAFYGCYSLASIFIPDRVTSIGSRAFSGCYGMRYYDFSACTSIPTLSNKDAFTDIPSDCQMLIPAALYDEWKSATNWATYASYMIAV